MTEPCNHQNPHDERYVCALERCHEGLHEALDFELKHPLVAWDNPEGEMRELLESASHELRNHCWGSICGGPGTDTECNPCYLVGKIDALLAETQENS